jgi:hypothetical protein
LPLWIRNAVAALPVKVDGLPKPGVAEIMKTSTKMIMTKTTTRMTDNAWKIDAGARIGMKIMETRTSMKTLVMERMKMTMMKMTGENEGIHHAVAAIRDGEAILQDADSPEWILNSAAALRNEVDRQLQDRMAGNFMKTSVDVAARPCGTNMVLNFMRTLVGVVESVYATSTVLGSMKTPAVEAVNL